MSLKAVHLFFVTALSALSFGCGVLKFSVYRSEAGTGGDLVFSVAAFITGALVIFYGRYFLKKFKSLSYL